MRTLKFSLVAASFVTVALLALGVLDLCRVRDDGVVEWAPSVRTSAIRHYGSALWDAGRDAVSPSVPAETARTPQPAPRSAARR